MDGEIPAMDEVLDFEDFDDCGNPRLAHYQLPTDRLIDGMLATLFFDRSCVRLQFSSRTYH
jgi:hypothetical protein